MSRGDGPAIRLRGEWLASAQQASRLEAQTSELHAQLSARDANNQALLQRCHDLEAELRRARSELDAASAELHISERSAASARAEALEREVTARTLAIDLPWLEGSHASMLKVIHGLQERTVHAEHSRRVAKVGADAALTELERMTKLHLSANMQVGSLKHKVRTVENELHEARQRAAGQQRHAQMLQRERERLNELITECRRQMQALRAASVSASEAYASRRAGGPAAAAAERKAAESLSLPVTARWTGGGKPAPEAATPAPAAAAAGEKEPRTPAATASGSGEAVLSGARTARMAAAPAEKGRAGSGRPGSAQATPTAGKRAGAVSGMSPSELNSVRTQLFGSGSEAKGAGALEPQDGAFVRASASGLQPSMRFRNFDVSSAEEREAALAEENRGLLLALQTQLQRCGHLEQTVSQLRAENLQLKYSRPHAPSAAPRAPPAPERADVKEAGSTQHAAAPQRAEAARAKARKPALPAAARAATPRAGAVGVLKPKA